MSSINSNISNEKLTQAVSKLQTVGKGMFSDVTKNLLQKLQKVSETNAATTVNPGYGDLLDTYLSTKHNLQIVIPSAFPKQTAVSFESIVDPIISSVTLQRKSKYQIIPRDGRFHYFKLQGKFVKKNTHLFELTEGSMPHVVDSLVVIDKELYLVPRQDVIRGIVRASRKLNAKKSTITYEEFANGNIYPQNYVTESSSGKVQGTVASQSVASIAEGGVAAGEEELATVLTGRTGLQSNTNKSALIGSLAMEDTEIADLLYEKQKRSLLDSLLEEEGGEEWEIEENS